ncbi:hypothetical protein LZ30DRAFT_87931 [Colletotrichum cereale]|nr:hypothetical protein LZ30DRAFT_87931 [Colletotrichum cereale]
MWPVSSSSVRASVARSDQRDSSGSMMRDVCVAPPASYFNCAAPTHRSHHPRGRERNDWFSRACRMRGCLETEGIVTGVSAICRCLSLSVELCSRRNSHTWQLVVLSCAWATSQICTPCWEGHPTQLARPSGSSHYSRWSQGASMTDYQAMPLYL